MTAMLSTPGVSAPPIAIRSAVVALLDELHGLLSTLTDSQYALRPVGPIDSSIGGHVRHSLDHIESLFSHDADSVLCYDHRQRGTPIETSRPAALEKIDALLGSIAGTRIDDYPLTVKAMVSTTHSVIMPSSFQRELLFVFSHTLHHNGQIRAMAQILAIPVPERFGYAPATLAFLDQKPCVR